MVPACKGEHGEMNGVGESDDRGERVIEERLVRQEIVRVREVR
jgi:hypothetical protein